MNQKIILAKKRIDGVMSYETSEKGYTSFKTSAKFEGYMNILWEEEETTERKKVYSNYDNENVKWFSILDDVEMKSRIMFNGKTWYGLVNEIERYGHKVVS